MLAFESVGCSSGAAFSQRALVVIGGGGAIGNSSWVSDPHCIQEYLGILHRETGRKGHSLNSLRWFLTTARNEECDQ